MNKASLIAAIRANFPAAAVPGPDDLVTSAGGEAVEVKNVFLKKAWTEVPKEDLSRHRNAVAFFTETAFRYYLPAFMLLVLEDIAAADTLATSLVRQLTVPTEVDTTRLLHFTRQSGNTNKGIDDFLLKELKEITRSVHLFVGRACRFTAAQGACVHTFLRLIQELYPEHYGNSEPVVAAERYWFQYPLLD